jgi:hypothetical protein
MADFDWGAYLSSIKPVSQPTFTYDVSPAGIQRALAQGNRSVVSSATPAILPLLQPGQDPYLQQAINSIVAEGQRAKERTLSDIGTEAMRRGLDVSSIVTGDIAQASAEHELGQMGQINKLLAQEQTAKRDMLVNFLMQAYGMDVSNANQMATQMAQLLGQEMASERQMSMFEKALKAQKSAQPKDWEKALQYGLQAAPTLLKVFSDRRLKKNLVPIASVGGVTFYFFEYNDVLPGMQKGMQIGVIADEVEHIPGAVIHDVSGYDKVDYGAIRAEIFGR